MANTTARSAKHIHGTNPQFLIEKVIRSRIYDSPFWKEHCFALTAESFVDRAVQVTYVGGTYGLQKPSPFVCLVCKLLQLQPDREIILEYLAYPHFKYLRAIAAMYVRLTFRAFDVYETLEPILNDYRKLRFRQMSGQYSLTYMDEFIDSLLREERVCELILPRLTRRDVLEETEGLAPRTSKLEDVLLLQKGNEDGQHDSDASDDSAKVERVERSRRQERAQRIRRERELEEERRRRTVEAMKLASTATDIGRAEMNFDDDYPSQEENDDSDGDRYVSRSPSRSGSELDAERKDAPRFVSRSPSRSPDRSSTGYRSRSAGHTPDRS